MAGEASSRNVSMLEKTAAAVDQKMQNLTVEDGLRAVISSLLQDLVFVDASSEPTTLPSIHILHAVLQLQEDCSCIKILSWVLQHFPNLHPTSIAIPSS